MRIPPLGHASAAADANMTNIFVGGLTSKMPISKPARIGRYLISLLLVLCCRSAAAQPAGLGMSRQPIVYGEDDRRDVYEVEEALLRERARRSTAAFIAPRHLSYDAGGTVTLVSPTLQETYDVCPEETFAEQPSAAFCTGVLLEQDLVATAAHCLGDEAAQLGQPCGSLAIVFNFLYEADGRLAPLTPESVYRCRQVVARSRTESGVYAADFAVIALDRPVSAPLTPAPVAATGPELGQRVHLISFGAGLPAKVDSGGLVTDIALSEHLFGANTDSFGGASGGPLFNGDGEVLGLHVMGRADWSVGPMCSSAIHADRGTEWHQRIDRVVDALCASGWPSVELCGLEPLCGDGYCSQNELPETCEADCPQPRCGNGLCERAEPPDCEIDCPSFVPAPPEWSCAPSYYGDRAGCDCGCGARDIDCDDPAEPVLDCAEGLSCDARGSCAAPDDPRSRHDAPETAVMNERREPGGCGLPRGMPVRRLPAFYLAVGLLFTGALAARARYG